MHKKVLALIFSVLSFSLVFASNAKALTIGSLEPEYDSGAKIEFNTPSDGNTFDVTFLAKNQNLTYRATITNDEAETIVITNLDLQTPNVDYLQYSFSGIAINDELAPGSSKIITIQISSNNNETHTTAEDFKLSIHYHKEDAANPNPNPNDDHEDPENPLDIPSTSTPDTGANHQSEAGAKGSNQVIFFIIVTVASIALLAILLSNKKVKNLHAVVAVVSLSLSFFIIGGVVTAEKDEVYTITGKVRFTNVYSISINPGAGLYNGESGIQTIECRDGEHIIISDPTYATYNFTGWATNPQTTFTTDNEGHRILVANNNYVLSAEWDEIYYNLTIDPNGGTYNGQTGAQVLPIRVGTTANLVEPVKEGANFTNWTKIIGENSEIVTDMSINIEEDVTLIANYEDIYFDVIINPNGGLYENSANTVTKHVKYGTELAISDPTYDTYNFAGWNIAPNTTLNEGVLTVKNNYTLTATWEEIYYILTINPNGGSYKDSTDTQEEYYRAGASASLTTPTKEGCNFTNWTKQIGEESETFTDNSITMNSNVTISANYEDQYFNVVVNPNGGIFNNNSEVYSTGLKYGSTLDLTNIERENYYLLSWTMNTNNSLPATSQNIQIYSDLELIANWELITYHTVTINPNGGLYNNLTDPTVVSNVLGNSTFNLAEASKDGYALEYWEVTSGTISTAVNGQLTASSFRVTDDVTLTAHWGRIVARIERTQNVYGSIMAAEAVAEENDTITLLVDTEETVVNEKKVTLDLNNHTVTGSLTNETIGNITLINGEINNPNGAAVTNNGTLTLGINDYKDDGTANILNDNIRLVGTTAGLVQTNDTYKFYYYDGYLEGDSGLVGGYDGSPFYRNTFDNVEVHFYPFVNHVEQSGRSYQHVELESSDRAVSKTSEHGDIYYYDLQDNINASIVTSYKIYIVRNFDATYTITSPADTTVTIDLVGYKVNLNDNMVVRGTLIVEDSRTASSTIPSYQNEKETMPSVLQYGKQTVTPHDGSSTTITYSGALNTKQTIMNYGTLNLKNATITNSSSVDTITNYGTLKMEGSMLYRSNGRVMQTTSTGRFELDSNSYITADSGNPAIQNELSNFVWDTEGVIYGYYGIQNASQSYNLTPKVTIKNGTVFGSNTGVYNYGSSVGTTVVDGGTIKSPRYGTLYGNVQMRSGRLISIAKDSYPAMAIEAAVRVEVSGGEIYASATNTRESSAAIGIRMSGLSNNNRQLTISGGNITTNAQGTGSSYAVYVQKESSLGSILPFTMSGGTINAAARSGDASGIYIEGNCDTTITGGYIYGQQYGVRSYNTENHVSSGGGTRITQPNPMIIGRDDRSVSTTTPEIIGNKYAITNGAFKFYDGVLRGNTKSFDDEEYLKATADGTLIHTESNDEYTENTWLVPEANYLSVNNVEYNSFVDAFSAADQNTPIILIKDKEIASTIPAIASNKNITFDLNGHTLTTMQSIVNNGTLTIVDTSDDGDGLLTNSSTDTSAIVNTKTLNINSGTIYGNYYTIENRDTSTRDVNSGGVVNLNGGTIAGSNVGIYNTSTTIKLSNSGTTTKGYAKVNITDGTINIEQAENATNTVYGIVGPLYGETTITPSNPEQQVIVITANGGTAYGMSSGGPLEMNGGVVIVNNTNGAARGLQRNSANSNIANVTINVTATGDSYGIWNSNDSRESLSIANSTVTSVSNEGTGYGLYNENNSSSQAAVLHSGSYYGSTYGVYNKNNSGATNFIIGDNDGTINTESPVIVGEEYALGGTNIIFYDGILHSNNKTIGDGTVSGMPEATVLHTEASNDYAENSWLTEAENFLQVGTTEYNSFGSAYEAATSENNIVKVIKDVKIESVIPETPSNKNIVFDLNGHELELTQSFIVGGSATIMDSSSEKTGKIINNMPSVAAVIDNGDLTIESGYIYSPFRALQTNQGTNLVINGGTLHSNETGLFNRPDDLPAYIRDINTAMTMVTITGGSIIVDGVPSTTTTKVVGILTQNGYTRDFTTETYATITITGGQISVDAGEARVQAIGISSTKHLTVNNGDPNGITVIADYGNPYGITANDGTVERANVYVRGSYSSINGITAASINNANVVVEETPDSPYNYTINARGTNSTTIKNSTVSVKCRGASTGIAAKTVENVEVNVETIEYAARGIQSDSSPVTVKNSTINSTSTQGESYGIISNGGTITSSTISTSSNEGVLSAGINGNSGTVTINTSTINSSMYGVYATNSAFTINFGTNDGILDTATPVVTAEKNAFNGVTLNFNDGTLMAKDGVLNNTTLLTPNGYNLYTGQIDDYEVYQLEHEHEVARIGDVNYLNLADAIADAGADDVIIMTNNIRIVQPLTIPSNKTITINTNGFNITANNQIANNGALKIIDTSDGNQSTHSYLGGNSYYIINNAGASLEFDDVSINMPRIVDNKGTLKISHSTISTTETGITSTGNIEIESSTLQGEKTIFEFSGSQLTITDSVLSGGFKNTGTGTANITNSTINGSATNTSLKILISNSGTMTFDNSQIIFIRTIPNYSSYESVTGIENSGTLSLQNGTDLEVGGGASLSTVVPTAINNTGTLNITDASIKSKSSVTWSTTTYGIQNSGTMTLYSGSIETDGNMSESTAVTNTGVANILSGTIIATGVITNSNCYGINNSGTTTIGTPEPTDSANYGGEFADVSTTDPVINGRVGNFNTGRLYWYDGKVKSISAPTGTEYLYEPTQITDENGATWTILTWMRAQP